MNTIGFKDVKGVYSYFPIYAEVNGYLSASDHNGFQWGMGAGVSPNSAMGLPMAFDCELIAVGISCAFSNAIETVEVYKNAAQAVDEDSKVADVFLNNNTGFSNINSFPDKPVLFSAGDIFHFRTVVDTQPSNKTVAVAWFRK